MKTLGASPCAVVLDLRMTDSVVPRFGALIGFVRDDGFFLHPRLTMGDHVNR